MHPGTLRQMFKRRRHTTEQTNDSLEYIVTQEHSNSEVEPLVIRAEVVHTTPASHSNRGYQTLLEKNLQCTPEDESA